MSNRPKRPGLRAVQEMYKSLDNYEEVGKVVAEEYESHIDLPEGTPLPAMPEAVKEAFVYYRRKCSAYRQDRQFKEDLANHFLRRARKAEIAMTFYFCLFAILVAGVGIHNVFHHGGILGGK